MILRIKNARLFDYGKFEYRVWVNGITKQKRYDTAFISLQYMRNLAGRGKIKRHCCLKISQKVAFNIASEASYLYILSWQKFIKNAKKNGQFWRVFELAENLKNQDISARVESGYARFARATITKSQIVCFLSYFVCKLAFFCVLRPFFLQLLR